MFGFSLVLFLLYLLLALFSRTLWCLAFRSSCLLCLPLALFSRTLWCLAFRSCCFCSVYRLYCFLVPFGVWLFARLVFFLFTACIVFSLPLVFGFSLVVFLLYLPLVLFSRNLWSLAFRSSSFALFTAYIVFSCPLVLVLVVVVLLLYVNGKHLGPCRDYQLS